MKWWKDEARLNNKLMEQRNRYREALEKAKSELEGNSNIYTRTINALYTISEALEGEGLMNIPKGYKEIDFDSVTGIFVSEKEIVITGFPEVDDETHNCDYMGCSSISHVIFRADITNIR